MYRRSKQINAWTLVALLLLLSQDLVLQAAEPALEQPVRSLVAEGHVEGISCVAFSPSPIARQSHLFDPCRLDRHDAMPPAAIYTPQNMPEPAYHLRLHVVGLAIGKSVSDAATRWRS
jgi:hypothetical protein